jgi:glutamate racemase
VAELLTGEYCEPFSGDGIDTLILGCTHYPLLAKLFAAALPGVELVNGGAEAAGALQNMIEGACPSREGKLRFFVSDDAEGFCKQAALFLRRDITEMAEFVDLEDSL